MTEQKRRPVANLCYKARDSKEKNKTLIAIWPGERGQTWSIDRNITKEEWVAIYDQIQNKKVWCNYYPAKEETAEANEPW